MMEFSLWIYLTTYYFRNRCSTGLYTGLGKYWNFQSEAKVEQIIEIITTRSVFCFVLFSSCKCMILEKRDWERKHKLYEPIKSNLIYVFFIFRIKVVVSAHLLSAHPISIVNYLNLIMPCKTRFCTSLESLSPTTTYSARSKKIQIKFHLVSSLTC